MRFASSFAYITGAKRLGITQWIGPLPAYLSPLQCALAKNAPATPLEYAFTKSLDLKPFTTRTYRKHRGGVNIVNLPPFLGEAPTPNHRPPIPNLRSPREVEGDHIRPGAHLAIGAGQALGPPLPSWLPDARGEGFLRAKAELLVQPHRGGILRRHGERERGEFPGAQRPNRSFHQLLSQPAALVAGQHADLRGVCHAGGHLRGQHHADELVGVARPQHKRSLRPELPAARQQNNVLQKFQRAGFAAVLVVDLAVYVIGIGQVNQPGAGLEVSLLPALQPQPRNVLAARGPGAVQRQQHELSVIQLEAVLNQRGVERVAEGRSEE